MNQGICFQSLQLPGDTPYLIWALHTGYTYSVHKTADAATPQYHFHCWECGIHTKEYGISYVKLQVHPHDVRRTPCQFHTRKLIHGFSCVVQYGRGAGCGFPGRMLDIVLSVLTRRGGSSDGHGRRDDCDARTCGGLFCASRSLPDESFAQRECFLCFVLF